MAERVQGAIALGEWLERNRVAQTELAALLQIHQATVSQWIHGTQRPSYADRAALEALCGITASAWLTAEEFDAMEIKLARIRRLAKTKPTPDDIYNQLAGRVKVAI